MASIKNKFIANLSMITLATSLCAPTFSYAQSTATCTVINSTSINASELFDFDKSNLSPQGQRVLDAYAQDLKKMKSVRNISLVGHTDGKGSVSYNDALGQRRADAVKAYLSSKGFSPNMIQASSKGKSELLNNELTADGKDDPVKRQANRRVVISTAGDVEVAGTNCPVVAKGEKPAAGAGVVAAAAGVVAAAGGVVAANEGVGGLSNAAIVGGVVVVGAAIAVALSGGGDGTTGTTGTTGAQ